MTHEYGPWATLIDAGGNPELSAFWRQRLTRLVPVSRTSPVLTRSNVGWLGLMAVLLLALPTLRTVPALAEEEKPVPAKGEERAKAAAPRLKQNLTELHEAQDKETLDQMGPFGGLPAYAPLASEAIRKQLGMTPDQEQKLREINAAFRPNWKTFMSATWQSQLSGQASPDRAEFRREAERVRSQVEGLLTPQQLASLRQIMLQGEILGLREMPEIRKTLDLSEAQSSALDRLREEVDIAIWRREQAAAAQATAVLTPEQRDKLNDVAGGEGPCGFFAGTKFSTYEVLDKPGARKELGLDDEQLARLQAISDKYTALAMKYLPELRREGKTLLEANKDKKVSAQNDIIDLAQQMRGDIHAVLTPEQRTLLKKLSSERYRLALLMGSHIQTQIGLSDAQREELRRVQKERTLGLQETAVLGNSGAEVWAALTPAQQAKFAEEVERRHGWLLPMCYQDPAAMFATGVGVFTTTSKSSETHEKPQSSADPSANGRDEQEKGP